MDAIAGYAIAGMDARAAIVPFSPYGYDERQLCSPGFNLPAGRLTRSVNGGFPEYHTSADDLSLIRPACLQQSFEACQQMVRVIEGDASYVNQSPYGEPMLGKRGLYGSTGGKSPAERENALLWVLNQSDGGHSLLDIARRSGVAFDRIHEAAVELEGAGLLRPVATKNKVAAKKRSRPAVRGKRSK
jgi:aminopeptidase-like protein